MDTLASQDYEINAESFVNDLVLDASGKNVLMVSDMTALLNVVSNVARTMRFELQYNLNKGIPYMQTIFQDATKVALWASYMQEAILAVDKVKGISYFDIKYDPSKSLLSYTAGILTEYGSTTING